MDAMKGLSAFESYDMELSPELNDALNAIAYPVTRIVALSGSMHKLTACKSLDFVFSASNDSLILLPRHVSAMLFEKRENGWVLAGVLEVETPFPGQRDVIAPECCAPHVDDVVVTSSTLDQMYEIQHRIDPLMQVLSSGITVHNALQVGGTDDAFTRKEIEGILRQFGTHASIRMADELSYAGNRQYAGIYARILKMLLEMRESLFSHMSSLPNWDESIRQMQMLYDSDAMVRKRRMDWDRSMHVLIDTLPHVKVLVKESNMLDALRNHCACYAWPTLQAGLNVMDISPMNVISYRNVRSSKLKDTHSHVQSFWMDRFRPVIQRFEDLGVSHPTYKCVMLLSVSCWMMTLLSGNLEQTQNPARLEEPVRRDEEPVRLEEPVRRDEEPVRLEEPQPIEEDVDLYEDLDYDYDEDV